MAVLFCYTEGMSLKDTIVHRILRVPYTLNVTEFKSPKKPRATVVLLHGIGNTSRSWDGMVPMLPKDIRVIAVDLLGFGKSPKPNWVRYDANVQARSLVATLLKLGLTQQVVLVGHSLGALVSVAAAKRYPLLVKRLVLCSPPFYDSTRKTIPTYDNILSDIYQAARRRPDRLLNLLTLAAKVGIANKTLDVSDKNINIYVEALGSSIINQTTLQDIKRLKVDIRIVYGLLDPVVIKSHIDKLGKEKDNITVRRAMVGHEVVGRYTNIVAEEISKSV